jgi:3-deoxy-D-manno-octulosonic-acid transferase
MQSKSDSERALSLGARPERVKTCGNLKYDVLEPAICIPGQSRSDPHAALAESLDRQLNLSGTAHLLVAGSTVAGEEEIVIRALKQLRGNPMLGDTRCVIAPRRPERFDEVAALLAESGLSFTRRSQRSEDATTAEVILLDTIGELAAIYRYATVVFVGGSLAPRGGHNVIEPAVYAKPIVVGPHTENFRQIVHDFKSAGALVQVGGAVELERVMTRLLFDRDEAAAMGHRARELLTANRGATDCIASEIASLTGG